MAMSIKMLTQLTETPPHLIWTGMKQMFMHSTAMMPHGPWPLHSTGPSLVRLCVCLCPSFRTDMTIVLCCSFRAWRELNSECQGVGGCWTSGQWYISPGSFLLQQQCTVGGDTQICTGNILYWNHCEWRRWGRKWEEEEESKKREEEGGEWRHK